ncbi:hypothetical protein [Bacillus cereus group sp. BfR-BA-01310]|uniref:hypothetical protein n=1 Tax=Bacillus cereus group sp. BfR-BA-01310 TaxID=2920287 RepID=UPI001F583DA4|nr:hypothetical protein [Bacillus cereus group sp. BfR-BA-01310]
MIALVGDPALDTAGFLADESCPQRLHVKLLTSALYVAILCIFCLLKTNLRKSCNKHAIVMIAIRPFTVRAITIDNSVVGDNIIYSETIDAIKGTTFLVLVMQNSLLSFSWGMILPIINKKGLVAKIPNQPKTLSINQGKSGRAEENINRFSIKRNNCMRDNLICINFILLHLREIYINKTGHMMDINSII